MMGGVLKREKAVRFGWRDPPLTRLPRAPCRRRRIEPDENDIALLPEPRPSSDRHKLVVHDHKDIY